MDASVHPLREWIEGHTSQAQFAREIDCSEAHLSDVLARRKRPSLRLAAKMSRATGGEVPIVAFVEVAEAAE